MIKDLIQLTIVSLAVGILVASFDSIFLEFLYLIFCAFLGWNYNKLNSIKIF